MSLIVTVGMMKTGGNFMRSVFIGASFVLLSGCATISMVPGEATVETELSADQTALRTAANTYCDQLEDEGWVSASNGFANFASILMHGEPNSGVSNSYSEGFEDPSIERSFHVESIAQDARAARNGLQTVTAEARKVLDNRAVETQRRDVTSFERALVRAQQASRAFAEALNTLKGDSATNAPAETAIADFNREIDTARRLADDLAARYASIGDVAA
ncbi:MAG: hypothetical protein AAF829_00435 [Pseudomonadota bacterium]